MKVVQINCSATGSTGNIARAIHTQLQKNGHDSYLFYGIGDIEEKNIVRIGNDLNLHIHAVLSRNFGKQGYFSYSSTYRLISEIKKIVPDIVHLHNLHGNYLNLPMLFGYLKKTDIQVSITLHDCWLFTGKCPHFTVAGCEKWKYACGECPQLERYPKSKVDTTKKSLLDKKKWLSGFENRLKIITVSDWLCNTAKQSFLASYPIQTIYNGINCELFHPVDGIAIRKKYCLENKFVILGVSSNWNDEKGFNEFLQLSEKLCDDEVIILVGLTEKQVTMLPKKIIGITKTENKTELVKLYSAANVFVNTSKEETFGLVTAEAMACGTPVIVYDSTACAEIIDKECGFIMPVNSKEKDIYHYISLMKCNDKFDRNMISKRIRYMYSDTQMVEKYMKIFGGMIK